MARLTQPINASDHVLGSQDAPAHLVEYGDFQCPYCGEAFPILQRLIHEMGDEICFAFRNFPLTESHEYAQIAAEAAEAAAAQGKFWQMHNIIYQNQDMLDEAHLIQFAQKIGLDMQRFEYDLQNHTYEDKVRADFNNGVRSGVNGTPTLFINGVRYDGPVEYQMLKQALEEAVEAAQA